MEDYELESETPKDTSEKTETTNQGEELLKKFQSAEAQKEHWREKATKFETELNEVKKQLPIKPVEEVKSPSTIDPKEIVRLTKSLNDLDEEEVAFVYRNAKNANDPQSVIEASKDEWVLDAIKTRRERVAKEKSIPDPSSAGKSQYGIDPDEAAKDPALHRKLWEEDMRKKQGGSGI